MTTAPPSVPTTKVSGSSTSSTFCFQSGFRLASVHEGTSVDEALDGCGFDLLVDDHVPTTDTPTDEAMDLLDEVIDPLGTRRLEVPAERAAAVDALASAG